MPSPRKDYAPKDRGTLKRIQSVLTLVFCAAAATAFVFLSDSSSSSNHTSASNAAASLSSFVVPEARRLARLLISPQGGASPAHQVDAASSSEPQSSEQSAKLLVALGEKNLKCEVALNSCTGDLERAKKALDRRTAAEASQHKLGLENKKLMEDNKKLMEENRKILEENKKLREENKKVQAAEAKVEADKERLQAEVEKLKKGSTQAAPQKALVSNAEGDTGGPTLESDNLSLFAEMTQASGQSNSVPQNTASSLAEKSDARTQATSAAAEKEAKEAARKVLEDCGAKQPPQVANAASKSYACEATEEELKQYFNYTPRAQCPDDWYFVQKLVYIKNCFCLPKRRCFAPSPTQYKEPTIPFPQSLFDPSVLQNDNVRWSKQYWPNYEALNNRKLGDCRDCFNLSLESKRWEVNFMGAIPIEQMLALKGKGSIKIGLDAGGGTGSFAAKMAQHGVTIVTTAMNTETLGGEKQGGLPYMETIAQRGLVPLFVPHKARQPFFDGTLDLVHNINSIKYFTIPEFEELLFEWDRILRPGGVMWFELFYAPVAEMPLYISVIEMFGYEKLYWNMTPKVDTAERTDVPHIYLNAVLEKPRRPENAPPLNPLASPSNSL